jgi:two-component system NtrC family sensor kinase
MRILIADDDAGTRRILRAYLSSWGHEIVECTNGVDALAVMEVPSRPAVAILDWEMPGLDGPTVCRRLRDIDRHVYVILLTVRAATEDVVEAIGAGADEHLSKISAPAELQARLRAALRVADMRHQLAQSEAALQQAVENLRSLVSSSPLPIATFDDDGRVQMWNAAAEHAFGYTEAEVLGRRLLRDCRIQWDADLLEQRIADCQRLCTRIDVNDFPYAIDGRERFLNIVLTPLTASRETRGQSDGPTDGPTAGPTAGIVLLASDVTEYRLRQVQRGQAQRLESIGALAAGIAHEINTPMQYIGDNVGFLRDSWPVLRDTMTSVAASAERHAEIPYLLAEIPTAIDQTLEGVARVSVIVRAMKEFAHPGTGECTPIDINHTIATTINVARHEWKYVCEIETDLSPELPLVSSRPGELNQVILNLLVNAAQAIADVGPHDRVDGRIAIRTRQVEDAIEISVADSGTGIPEAIRGRIFDPFFTTKEVGRGTGQGLAIVHDIVVHKHQGRIWFETQVGTGTTFHVRLPLQAMRTADGHLEADPVRR